MKLSFPSLLFSSNCSVQYRYKGGIISENFSLQLKSLNKDPKSDQLLIMWIVHAQDSDLAPFLGDLNQSENLSAIKPALGT